MSKKLIDRRKYKEIKAMDHVQMSDFFYGLYDRAYNDGFKKGSESCGEDKLSENELRELLIGVKGIGEIKLKAITHEIKQVLAEKSANCSTK